jgi:signal transduction histidine kinase
LRPVGLRPVPGCHRHANELVFQLVAVVMSIPSIIPIYFFYGLAFFSMGLLVMLEGGRSSDARLRRALRPMAAFGLIHAANEWLEMFQSMADFGGRAFPDWIIGLRLGMLAFSFVSLAAFGSYLMVVSQSAWRLTLLVPLGLESFWVFGLILLRGHYSTPILWEIADNWTRYSLAIPAALLAAIGLIIQQRVFRRAGLTTFGRDTLWAAVAFGWYGLVGQLFVPVSPLFPSNVVNEDLFFHLFGIPVQAFRALMAMAAAFFVIRFLRAFQVETDRHINSLQKARLKESEQRETLKGELYKRIVAAQESERQRIARELHDETGQALTAIGMGLRSLESGFLTTGKGTTRNNLRELETLTAHSLDELQRLIADLRPSHLDDLGLSSALRWYAGNIQERTKLDMQVETRGNEPAIPSPVKTAIFRIVQEALTNVIKHAHARNVKIFLAYTPKAIKAHVVDDGNGFNMDSVESTGRISWGLKGMEERASLLGGNLKVYSKPNEGTTVEVIIPILPEETDEDTAITG